MSAGAASLVSVVTGLDWFPLARCFKRVLAASLEHSAHTVCRSAAVGPRTVQRYPIATESLRALKSCHSYRALGEVATRDLGVAGNRVEEVRMVNVAAHPTKAVK